jgi:hypothetical protein
MSGIMAIINGQDQNPARDPIAEAGDAGRPVALALHPERLSSFQLRTYSRLLIAHRFELLRKLVAMLDSFDDNARAMQTIADLLLSDDALTQQNALELTTRQLTEAMERYLIECGARKGEANGR